MIFRDNFYNRLTTMSVIGLVFCTIYVLFPVFVPFIIAFVCAYLLNPIVERVTKFGVSRQIAIGVVFLFMGMTVTIAISYLVPLLWNQFETAQDNMPVFIEWLNNTARPLIISRTGYEIEPLNASEISNEILQYLKTNYNVQDARSMFAKIATSGISALSSFGLFILIPMLLFFYLLSWNQNIQLLLNTIPPRMQAKTTKIAKECHDVMMAFVKGQMTVMLILSLIYGVGLQLSGLETGLMIGFMTGMGSIIPYFGIVVGIVAAVIATIVQFGVDVWHLVAIVVIFGAGQLIESMILQPILLGDRIGLSPVMVILVVLVGGSLMGFVGMLIALPLAAVLMVLYRHLFASYQTSDFYQRKKILEQQKQLNSTQDLNTHSSDTSILQLFEKNVEKKAAVINNNYENLDVLSKKNDSEIQPTWISRINTNQNCLDLEEIITNTHIHSGKEDNKDNLKASKTKKRRQYR